MAKKVLILSVTAGNGHNACAKGVIEKLLAEDSSLEIKKVDLLKDYSSKFNAWLVDKGYNIAIGKLPKVFDWFYNFYKKRASYKRYSAPSHSTCLTMLEGLYKEINDFKPDVIFCTHFYGAMAITELRLVYSIPCKVVVTNLDYVNSPFWECGIGVDYFAVPNNDFVQESIEEGFSENQLQVTGLPVGEKFLETIDTVEARRILGLKENVFTVMIIFGGGHWNGGYKIFKQLVSCFKTEEVQIIMINGRNKNSFNKIENTQFSDNITVCNVGFTDKVHMYLSACDVVINKIGGPSATEIINKLKPMIITENVFGQERYNLKYLKQKNIAYSFKNKKQLKQIVFKFKEDKNFYNSVVENISKFRVNGIDKLAKLILSSPTAQYDNDYINNVNYGDIRKNVKKALKIAYKQEKIAYKAKKTH